MLVVRVTREIEAGMSNKFKVSLVYTVTSRPAWAVRKCDLVSEKQNKTTKPKLKNANESLGMVVYAYN